MDFLKLIWVIPLFPAAGAILIGLLGKNLPKRVIDIVACGSVGLALLASIGAVNQLLHLPASQRHFEVDLFTWVPAGMGEVSGGRLAPFLVPWGFQLDPLSAVMILVVAGVGFVIHIYSTGYMAHEAGYYRFFSYLNLFMFSMLMLVLANNFLLMFVGWEGVGLCSYLLIGFYFYKKSASDAGKKAFIVNRVGDYGFMLGLFLIFTTFGSLDFSSVFETVKSQAASGSLVTGDAIVTAICILLFIGATGKSAQVPLYVWLPDAMEGPTPVSALIHAATMVTAGVYMVARCNALFVLSPTAMLVVAVVGALTAIFAASIGLVQNDIKRILAYSTVSQLGYMFLGCGVGAFGAGIFHLMTHAFFKALLFLGSGSVIHALGGEQDVRKMGGLKDKIRTTWGTMLVGTVAIAGFPPLAGFFSKDEILWRAYASERGHWLLWLVGAVAAGMTAFYMFRMLYLTFYGKSRLTPEVEHHVHESPASMTVPLLVLAAGSVVAGWVGIPHVMGQYLGHLPNAIEHFLEPVFEHPVKVGAGHGSEGAEWGLMGLSVGIALAGMLLARQFYLRNPALPERLMNRFRGLYITLLNKYWVDEIYDALIVNRMKGLGTFFARFDLSVIDGGVNGSAWLTRLTASVSGFLDYWVVDFAVRRSDLLYYMSYPVRRLQTGIIQNYAAFTVAGILLIVTYFFMR
jgi:NADH-quinone oxidoreductase subunit L